MRLVVVSALRIACHTRLFYFTVSGLYCLYTYYLFMLDGVWCGIYCTMSRTANTIYWSIFTLQNEDIRFGVLCVINDTIARWSSCVCIDRISLARYYTVILAHFFGRYNLSIARTNKHTHILTPTLLCMMYTVCVCVCLLAQAKIQNRNINLWYVILWCMPHLLHIVP